MFMATAITIIPNTGILDSIFHKTWITINILGLFGDSGFKLNLAGLIVIILVGILATAITERLVGEKPGKNLLGAILFTLFGAYIFAGFIKLPFELMIESVPIVAALIGAIVFGVFFVLFKKQFSRKSA